MGQFHFDPEHYLELIHSEVPQYDRLQDETARATGTGVETILELGTGTGETTRRVLAQQPGARLLGIDASPDMISGVKLERTELRVGRLEDPLPSGPFDLVFSCLAVHHLDGAGKRDLFRRIAERSPIFVLGDVITPDDPADAVTPLTPGFDLPDRLDDQLSWLADVGFEAEATWVSGDLAVIRAAIPD